MTRGLALSGPCTMCLVQEVAELDERNADVILSPSNEWALLLPVTPTCDIDRKEQAKKVAVG